MADTRSLPVARSVGDLLLLLLVMVAALGQLVHSAPSLAAAPQPASGSGGNNSGNTSCRRELENANRTMTKWSEQMENMVNESELPVTIREGIHNEANKILDLIEDFCEQITTKPAYQLARDLVTIRRRSNRMALDIYLNTFDMRWPQQSLQVGVIVERVQQACLDQAAIQVLESPANPLEPLGKLAAAA